MQSFLITGSDEQGRLNKIQEIIGREICNLENNPDFIILQAEKISIGIEETRSALKKLTLKPFAEKQIVLIVIEAQNLTLEAQNSLLKTLEEPPLNCEIYLLAPDASLLIQTIVSRCQIIVLSQNYHDLSKEEEEKLLAFLAKILTLTSGKRLKEIEKEDFIKDRVLAIEWIDKLTLLVRKEMLQTANCLPIFSLLNRTKNYLSANCNVRLAIENFLLDLPYENK